MGEPPTPSCSVVGKPCAYYTNASLGVAVTWTGEKYDCTGHKTASVALSHIEVLHAYIGRDYKKKNKNRHCFFKIYFYFFYQCIIHLLKSIFLIPVSACANLALCGFLGGRPRQGWNEKRRQNKTLFYLSVRILATGSVCTSASYSEMSRGRGGRGGGELGFFFALTLVEEH